jgi:cytoskeletal protein RodZ
MEQSRTTVWKFLIGVLVVLVIAAGVWIFFFKNSDPKNTNQKETPSSSPTVSKARPDDSNDAETKRQTSPTQPAQNKKDSNNTAAGQQLANAGPGNAPAIFISASILGAVSHYLCRRLLYRSS